MVARARARSCVFVFVGRRGPTGRLVRLRVGAGRPGAGRAAARAAVARSGSDRNELSRGGDSGSGGRADLRAGALRQPWVGAMSAATPAARLAGCGPSCL
jgi:hypothetical protein